MARKLKCPDDAAPMQPLFFAPAKGGVQVELDRCTRCGALWFDAGELEILAGLDSRDTDAESKRQCPNCQDLMADATLARDTVGQRCERCHGTFVDGKQVKRLRALSLPSLVQTDENEAVVRRSKPSADPRKTAKPNTIGFECAKCGGRFPFAEGNGTSRGLVCRGCVVIPTVDPRSSRGVFASSTDVYDDDAFLGEWDLSDLF